MNKKFIRVISLLLSVMVIFTCAVSASAEEPEKIEVSIRVEGLDKTLANKEVKVAKDSTVKDVLETAALDVTYTAEGKVASVKGEAVVTSSQWQYAVDGVIKSEDVSACKVADDADIVLFNATSDAVIPSFNADEIELSGVITFVGTNKSGAKAPIVGAEIKWETKSGFATYTTDKDGKIFLAQDVLTEGDHTVEIMKKNAYGVPQIVRLEAGTEIEVDEIEEGEKEVTTLFDDIYNFFYSIFKGIVEVWGFYLNAILGLFGVQMGE